MTSFRQRLLLWFLDLAQLCTNQKCLAYGGKQISNGQVRLCTKTRWHWDSHAYTWMPDD